MTDNMNIDSLDWSGRKHSVEIPDDAGEVTIKLVTGDGFKALSSLKGSYDLFSLAKL